MTHILADNLLFGVVRPAPFPFENDIKLAISPFSGVTHHPSLGSGVTDTSFPYFTEGIQA